MYTIQLTNLQLNNFINDLISINKYLSTKISNNDYKYLKNFENKPIFSLNEMWLEMDKIWDSLHLNNRKSFRLQNIGDYYSHPVWILNGLFSIRDKESSNHRLLIASYIKNLDKNRRRKNITIEPLLVSKKINSIFRLLEF